MGSIDTTNLLDNAAALFNGLGPAFFVVIGIPLFITFVKLVASSLRTVLGEDLDLPDKTKKPSSFEDDFEDDSEPDEKRKNGFVTIGDDGELVDVPDDAPAAQAAAEAAGHDDYPIFR